MSKPVRVMMLITDLQRGGTPLRTVKLAAALRDQDVQPIVGSLAPRGPLHDELDKLNIPSFHCDAAGARSLGVFKRLAAVIESVDPDIIHAGLFHANIAARLVGRLDRARPIITSTVTIEIERKWHNWLEGFTAHRSDIHVANSTAVRSHLLNVGFDPQRTVVIRNGLDIDGIAVTAPVDLASEGFSEDRPLIVWAGRMDKVKNLQVVIQTVARMRDFGAQFVLIGDGPERSRVEAWISAERLHQSVRLIGWRDDVWAWLRAASCLLFPSHTEGAPNVVLEAMAAGCPVVASRIPPHEALIADGATGFLVAADDVEGFASRVAKFLGNPVEAQRIAESAARVVRQNHDLAVISAQWADLYRSVVG